VKVFLLGGRRTSSHPLTRHLIAHRIGDQNHAFFLDIATSPLMTAGLHLRNIFL